MKSTYDVAIVGAGPGGAAAASYLAKSGARVLLVDKADFPRHKTCGDALSPNALKILEDLGLLDEVKNIGYRLNGIRLVAPDGSHLEAPVPSKPGLADYLYIAPRYQLDNLLLRHAIAMGAEFEPNIRITGLQAEPDRAAIIAANDHSIHRFSARVAIIAVGANISLLQSVGLMSTPPAFALAARAYFDDLTDLDDIMEIRFDGAPLPGYGWIFPTSPTSANVGAGYMKKSPNLPATAQGVLEKFLSHDPVREKLADGRRLGPVKSYPLRMDFATARTFGDRMIVVGEAAGLVNPFTGEGIDYAMESGQIAAQVLREQLETNDFSRSALRRYDKRLRARFQSLFVWTIRMRTLYMNDWLLNPLIRAANRESFVERSILEVLLSYRNAVQALSPRMIYHVLRNWM